MRLIIFILIFFFCISGVDAEIVYLPYTDTSNSTVIVDYPTVTNETYIYISGVDNEIYSIKSMYKFSDELYINNGVYINNLSFLYNIHNITLSEVYTITNGFLFTKEVKRELFVYEDNVLSSTVLKEFTVFKTAPYFAASTYTFLNSEIKYKNEYSSTKGFTIGEYSLDLPYQVTVNQLTQSGNLPHTITLQYVKTGEKPKSYYVSKLNPIFKYPYKIIQSFDGDNYLLNILLILSYLLKAVFFWFKVIYQSFFVIQFFILGVIIPAISLSNSRNPKGFLQESIKYYAGYFNMVIRIIRYVVDLIISLIKAIPFI